ncbi:protein FAR1-RELATED SEQUENCE 5-like [Salvia miltiorrhiza]|uniref:protein FAR1-RELATED SEQUENCE 5-like n=1 Tax=Salvia miltiorrhiza TaxID=226208 RepID=UPI0025AC0244|nr:protein FAR1-RELATED SEQUENCE 5-like [Salvia miltiorrhiza]
MEQPVSNLGFVHLLNAQNVASQLHANVMPHVAHNVNVAQGHILSDTVNIESENERSNEWIYDNDDVAEDDDGDDVDTDYDVGDDVDIDYDDGDDVDSLDEDNDDVVEDVVHAMSNRHTVQPLGSSSVSDIVEGDDLQYHSTRGRQWVIPGAVYQDTFSCDNVGVTDLYRREALSPGCTYADKEKLQIALGLYHLNNRVDYVVERSNKKRFAAVCRDKEKCTFLMRATSVGTGSVWRVSKWNAPHTCEMDLRKHGRRTVGAKVIGAFFAPTLLNEGAILRPKEMLAQLQRQFGIQVDYKTALMGRNYAVSMIYGDTDRSFQQLPSYLFMVQQANPGTVVELQTDSSNCFQYVFMALSASISGFLASGRLVIVVDGTHLKGKYKGIMFVAATKDGNEQIFPLVVGIGDKENDNSWTWFFRQLRKTFGCPDHLLFVSDQHRSIKNAVEVVYPGIPHGLCTYHLQKKLSRYGVHVVSMFQKCARCYRSPEFDIHFSNLSLTCDGAYRRLVEVEPRRWAQSQCPVRRYEFLTSNCAESFNSRLRWARRLPICTLMEFVRSLIGHWVVERREKALSRTHELTDYATKKLERSLEEGRTMAVEAINSMKFKVSEGTKHYIVDLNERSCSCREFDMDLIPCSHAAAAISKLKLSCIAFVSTYYTTQTLREMYAAEVIPVLHSDEWCVPFEVQSRVVGVPINPTQSGRPRTSRIDS